MSILKVTLSSLAEAHITTFNRLGVECWAVGIYWAGTIISSSTHMSYQGCVQWAYKQMHEEKKAALVQSGTVVL